MLDVILAILATTAQTGDPAAAVHAPGGAPVAQAPAALSPPPPALIAEPQDATGRFTTALEVRPILAATRSNWIHVREFQGQDLLYVTHLWSWRCGLAQIRLSVNGGEPEVWPLPACHLDEGFPNMIKAEDGMPYREYPLGSVQAVTVELTYDDLGTETLNFGRDGQPRP